MSTQDELLKLDCSTGMKSLCSIEQFSKFFIEQRKKMQIN